MRRKKRKHSVSWEDAVSVCAWCGKPIPEGSELFSLGAKARPGVDLEREGNVLELTLDAKRKALAIIPAQDSQAKKEGWDLLFTICSEECAKSLKETVQRQIDIIDGIVAAA
jgi:predicted nucleic acid-binding Zn ribbon protein